MTSHNTLWNSEYLEKNSFFQAFTLNSVPPSIDEIVAGGIGRNFISRDLLEATSIDDALSVSSFLCQNITFSL